MEHKMGKNTKRRLTLICILFVLTAWMFSACSYLGTDDLVSPDENTNLVVDADQPDENVTVTLYFKYKYSELLVPTERTVVKTGSQSTEYLVVKELLKGPLSGEFNRIAVMPEGLSVINVSRNNDTVFVSLNDAITKSVLVDAWDVSQFDSEEATQNYMKVLCLYSIVNSLTEIDGINQVKFLINDKVVTYEEIGAELLIPTSTDTGSTEATQNASTPMNALTRSRAYNLQPWNALSIFLKAFSSDADPEQAYNLLASTTISGEKLDYDNFLLLYNQNKWVFDIPSDSKFTQEILSDGRVYVSLDTYKLTLDGKTTERKNDCFTIVNENGIWKLKFPQFLE